MDPKIFLVFLRLGLTSFGGPVAHLGYFHQEFVVRRRWLSERSYAELVTLCHFLLPGPASSQVGIALGLSQAGYRGALAAWCGFTLPSALLLILLALGLNDYGDALPMGILHGLKVVAVAIVAQAVRNMARVLCPDLPRIALMLLAASAVLLVSSAWVQLAVIVAAGVAGLLLFKPAQAQAHESLPIALSRRTGALWLGLFVALLLGLPLADRLADPTLGMLDAFYRTGALVFGGGHVMLPLLQAEVVPNGWVDNQTFLAGYGATQAMPGPLFTFAAFLGASMHGPQTSWLGGLLALLAIFAPAFLLVFGALPFWEQLRGNRHMQAALLGINAAVVGLLLAQRCTDRSGAAQSSTSQISPWRPWHCWR